MILRLRAESEGVMVTLESMRRFGSETLASCLGSPMSKNSGKLSRVKPGGVASRSSALEEKEVIQVSV